MSKSGVGGEGRVGCGHCLVGVVRCCQSTLSRVVVEGMGRKTRSKRKRQVDEDALVTLLFSPHNDELGRRFDSPSDPAIHAINTNEYRSLGGLKRGMIHLHHFL
jgi:hypothetical protein